MAKAKKDGTTTGGATTPLMQQYIQVKTKYPDAILLFRVGDFYETFGEDAVKASRALGITLTSRNNGGSDITLPDYLWLPALSARGMPTPTQNLRSEGSYSGFVPTFNVSFAVAQ